MTGSEGPSPGLKERPISSKNGPNAGFRRKLEPPTNWGALHIMLPLVVDFKKNLKKKCEIVTITIKAKV
jgi:hypothetical protein